MLKILPWAGQTSYFRLRVINPPLCLNGLIHQVKREQADPQHESRLIDHITVNVMKNDNLANLICPGSSSQTYTPLTFRNCDDGDRQILSQNSIFGPFAWHKQSFQKFRIWVSIFNLDYAIWRWFKILELTLEPYGSCFDRSLWLFILLLYSQEKLQLFWQWTLIRPEWKKKGKKCLKKNHIWVCV